MRITRTDMPSSASTDTTYSVQNELGFAPSWFTILAAEQYSSGNSVWYQIAVGRDLTIPHVYKASVDDTGHQYRVYITDLTNITKFRILIAYIE